MSARRLFLDRGIGETRGLVTLDGVCNDFSDDDQDYAETEQY